MNQPAYYRPGGYRPLLLVAAAIVAFSIVWYPSAIAIEDESAYLAQGDIFSRGDLIGTGPSDGTTAMVKVDGGWISKYPPGQSLLIALTRIFPGWRTAFLVPLCILGLLTVLFVKVLQREAMSPGWAVLLLLHPSIVLYSRTLMSDLTAGALLTAAFLATDPKRPRWFAAGLLLGATPLVRSAIVPLALILGLFALVRTLRTDREATKQLVGGALISVLLVGLYYWASFGNPFAVPPGSGGGFDLATAHNRFLFYLLALNVAWPFMMWATLTKSNSRSTEIRALFVFNLLFFSAYYFVDRRYGLLTDLVVGQRFFVPLIPLMLLPYARWLSKLRLGNFRETAGVLAIIGAIAADGVIVAKHQQLLDTTAGRRDAVMVAAAGYGRILIHTSASELFNPAWDADSAEVFFLLSDVETALTEAACAGQKAVAIAQGTRGTALSLDLTVAPGNISGLAFIPSDSVLTRCEGTGERLND